MRPKLTRVCQWTCETEIQLRFSMRRSYLSAVGALRSVVPQTVVADCSDLVSQGSFEGKEQSEAEAELRAVASLERPDYIYATTWPTAEISDDARWPLCCAVTDLICLSPRHPRRTKYTSTDSLPTAVGPGKALHAHNAHHAHHPLHKGAQT